MRSSLTWLTLLCSMAAGSVACSSDNSSAPSQSGTEQLQGGTGGTGVTTTAASTAESTAAGGTGSAAAPTQPVAGTPENAVPIGIDEGAKNQNGGVQSVVDAGTKEDAGRAEAEKPDAGAPAAPEADAGAVAAVTFANVFPILVTNCGSCHGANARGNLPEFANASDPTASFQATQGMSMNDLVSNRIIQRAVFQGSMPPNCRGGQPGAMSCISVADADELQAWVNQGAKQ